MWDILPLKILLLPIVLIIDFRLQASRDERVERDAIRFHETKKFNMMERRNFKPFYKNKFWSQGSDIRD